MSLSLGQLGSKRTVRKTSASANNSAISNIPSMSLIELIGLTHYLSLDCMSLCLGEILRY
jgi:hypothetical protein